MRRENENFEKLFACLSFVSFLFPDQKKSECLQVTWLLFFSTFELRLAASACVCSTSVCTCTYIIFFLFLFRHLCIGILNYYWTVPNDERIPVCMNGFLGVVVLCNSV